MRNCKLIEGDQERGGAGVSCTSGERRRARRSMGHNRPAQHGPRRPGRPSFCYLPFCSRYAANADNVSGSALPGTDSRTASS